MSTKICCTCNIEKPLSEFYRFKDVFQANCKSCAKLAVKEWQKSNAKRFNRYHKDYQSKHKKETKEYNKVYKKKRYAQDLDFKIRCLLRTRVRNAVRKGKAGSAIKDLGCTVKELRNYLESKFILGMSWENFGKWHIDHVRPLASFDLSIREEFLAACHFTNLQPLWAEDNIRKGMRV